MECGYIDRGKFGVNLGIGHNRSFSKRGGVKGLNRYFSLLIIRVHENLVQHPSNIIMIDWDLEMFPKLSQRMKSLCKL